MADLVLRDGRPWGADEVADIVVRDGVIAAMGPGAADRADAHAGVDVIDVAGDLVLPGLVEGHCHVDKTLFGGDWVPHSAGDTLAERIANERARKAELGLPSVERIVALLEAMATNGTTHVRTHSDVDPETGLAGIDAVTTAAARLAGRISVEQVAFPQSGILTCPGTAELLDEALAKGAAAIGGIDPAGVDRDPVRHLEVVLGLAERHGARVDIHLHDPGALGAWELELIADMVEDAGLHGRVTVSHAYALGQADEATQDRLVDRLATAGITVLTAAVYSFPVPPIRKLRAAGVNVACGHDGIRDLWGPYGNADMLSRAMHVAYRSGFRRDQDIELALEAATHGGARALGLDPYGLAVGAPADLVVVPARTPAEAVVTHPPRHLVVKAGRVVARSGELVRPAPPDGPSPGVRSSRAPSL